MVFEDLPSIDGPLDIFAVIAYFAFPILPYELFVFMPMFFAYWADGHQHDRYSSVSPHNLVVAITYWGAIYGGGVHTVALLAVLSGLPYIDAEHGLCKGLPPPTPGPWCKLLTGHAIIMIPMGYYFIYLVWKDKKKCNGWFKFMGHDERVVLRYRCALYFITAGFSGNLPYYGQIGIQGLDVFAGTGVYAGTTWFPWYNGRGYIEFLAYNSWFLFGFYFLAKAVMAGKGIIMM